MHRHQQRLDPDPGHLREKALNTPLPSSPRTGPLAALALLLLAACDRRSPEPAPAAVTRATAAASTAAAPPARAGAFARPEAAHVVAIGDLHGDLDATRRALRLAGATDEADRWVGGPLVVVQTGDAIDRGDEDRQVLDLLEKLQPEAEKAGGALVLLSGNHELMNVAFDFRYVTPRSFATFADIKPGPDAAGRLADFTPAERGRAAAFAPGGPYAVKLAARPVVVRVGSTLFAHGGVLPEHVTYGLDRMNDEVRAWMLGQRPSPPSAAAGEDGAAWTRAYSIEGGQVDCARLGKALAAAGASRLVVGHTPQSHGMTSACEGKVWRIDVGLSHYYGGPLQVLDIEGDAIKVRKQGG